MIAAAQNRPNSVQSWTWQIAWFAPVEQRSRRRILLDASKQNNSWSPVPWKKDLPPSWFWCSLHNDHIQRFQFNKAILETGFCFFLFFILENYGLNFKKIIIEKKNKRAWDWLTPQRIYSRAFVAPRGLDTAHAPAPAWRKATYTLRFSPHHLSHQDLARVSLRLCARHHAEEHSLALRKRQSVRLSRIHIAPPPHTHTSVILHNETWQGQDPLVVKYERYFQTVRIVNCIA